MSNTPQSDPDIVAGIARVTTLGTETGKVPESIAVQLPRTEPAHA